jgi:hypothetical protein
MRRGRTTPSRRFTGYKLHAAAAAEAPILTALSLSPANEHDGYQAERSSTSSPNGGAPSG